jgi:hypothetical protein
MAARKEREKQVGGGEEGERKKKERGKGDAYVMGSLLFPLLFQPMG